jgi:hypothetical protein
MWLEYGVRWKLYSEIFRRENLTDFSSTSKQFQTDMQFQVAGFLWRNYLTPGDTRGTRGIKYDGTSNPGSSMREKDPFPFSAQQVVSARYVTAVEKFEHPEY